MVMNMKNDQSLMKFPCDFQIKIIGTHTESFVMDIINITRKHYPDTKDESIRKNASQQNNYLAMTITLYVHDQVTLDALYIELNKHPDIKMVL